MASDEEKLTLRYFNGYGRGEIIRYILYYAQVNFEDYRVPFSNEWLALKKTLPTAQLPVLEITKKDGSTVLLCQSGAIAQFLAKRYGVTGKTEMECYKANEAFECVREFVDLCERAVFLETDETKKAKLVEELGTIHMPRLFGHLEQKLLQSGGEYIAGGNELTIGDLAIAVLFDFMRSLAPFNLCDVAKVEKSLPALTDLAKRVCETPSLKRYLDSRPADQLIEFRLTLVASQLSPPK